jgi:hypothetical protein
MSAAKAAADRASGNLSSPRLELFGDVVFDLHLDLHIATHLTFQLPRSLTRHDRTNAGC